MHRQLRFFCIDAKPGGTGRISQEGQPFGEMDPITAAQAVKAIQHSKRTGSEIELYLCEDQPNGEMGPDGTPLVGFCFRAGNFYGCGLGHSSTDALETEAATTTDWLAFFEKALLPAAAGE